MSGHLKFVFVEYEGDVAAVLPSLAGAIGSAMTPAALAPPPPHLGWCTENRGGDRGGATQDEAAA